MNIYWGLSDHGLFDRMLFDCQISDSRYIHRYVSELKRAIGDLETLLLRVPMGVVIEGEIVELLVGFGAWVWSVRDVV